MSYKGMMILGLPRSCDSECFNVELYEDRLDPLSFEPIDKIDMYKSSFKISVDCEGCCSGFCQGQT